MNDNELNTFTSTRRAKPLAADQSRPDAPAGPSLGPPAGLGATAHTIPLALLYLYTFLMLSRLPEFLLRIPRLMSVLGFFTIGLTFLSTGGLRGIGNRMTTLFLLYTGMMVLSIPFSVWRGGAVASFYGWLPILLMYIAGTVLVTNLNAVRNLMYVIAAATLFIMTMAVISGDSIAGGRLALSESSTVGNANDLATAFLFGLPGFMLLFIASHDVFRKIPSIVIVVIGLVLTLRTGSRAGLLAIVLMLIVIFWSVSGGKKLIFLAVVSVLAVASVMILPDALKARFLTISHAFSNSEDPSLENSAYSDEIRGADLSADQRRLLLEESIRMTFRHPLLGVGIGQFAPAAHDAFRERHLSIYQPTHNSYTQVSSDLGIPGLLIYFSILVHMFRTLSAVLRRSQGHSELKPVASLAYCVRLSLIAFCATSAFTSVPYKFYLPVLGVLVCGLGKWLQQSPADRQGPVPAFSRHIGAGVAPGRRHVIAGER